MTLPNFIIIGAARSGTTALFEYLGQHPDVFISEPKEPHFFPFEGKTVAFKGPGDDVSMNQRTVTDFARYQALFAKAGAAKAVGEASVSYLYYPDAIAGIKRYVPGAKLIAMLRQPADRAYSAWGLMRARMFEPLDDFAAAMADEDRRVAEQWHHIWHYRRMGFYGEQMQRYFDAFPREQIRVYLYEDFRRDPMSVVRDAFSFIGVDPSFVPPKVPQTVIAGTPKNVGLQSAMMWVWRFKTIVRSLIPQAIRAPIWRKLNAWNLKRDSIDPAVRARLVDVYRDDMRRLEGLLGRDLSAWGA